MFDYRDIEATKLDYKLCLEEKKPRSWLKSVSAFASTKGGYILFGVTNDTHEVSVWTTLSMSPARSRN